MKYLIEINTVRNTQNIGRKILSCNEKSVSYCAILKQEADDNNRTTNN